MSREIKFRVWDVSNKQFLEDFPDFFFGYRDKYCDGGECYKISLQEALEDDLYEPQMFTGLKDKDGREVYEGDILKVNSRSGLPYQVIWADGSVKFDYAVGFVLIRVDWGVQWDMTGRRPFKVLGNVFENPELSRLTVD